jgi:hypothetical protein
MGGSQTDPEDEIRDESCFALSGKTGPDHPIDEDANLSYYDNETIGYCHREKGRVSSGITTSPHHALDHPCYDYSLRGTVHPDSIHPIAESHECGEWLEGRSLQHPGAYFLSAGDRNGYKNPSYPAYLY